MSDEQKQAIQDAVRETLLSEEFLTEFARAFGNTSITALSFAPEFDNTIVGTGDPVPNLAEVIMADCKHENSNHISTVTYE